MQQSSIQDPLLAMLEDFCAARTTLGQQFGYIRMKTVTYGYNNSPGALPQKRARSESKEAHVACKSLSY